MIDDFERGVASFDDLTKSGNAVRSATLLSLLVLGVAAIAWMTWQWRVATNLETLGRADRRWGPGWSVGGWLIPIVNLVMPGIVLRKLWRASSPAETRPSPPELAGPVLTWWIPFAAGCVLRASANIGRQSSLDDFHRAELRDLLGTCSLVIAGIAAIFLTRQLTGRLESLRAAVATPVGWFPDPSGVHELRYRDDGGWTEHVSAEGHTRFEP